MNTITIPAANNFQTIDLLAAFKADGGVTQGVTVYRTHLLTTITSNVNGTTNFSYGLLRGQNTDVGQNIAGAPVPDTDPYEDWAYWTDLSADFNGNPPSIYSPSWTFPLDLKAMRKLPELQMTWNYVLKCPAAAAFPFVAEISGRVLLGLP